jgi:two-component system chemotaxis response regulator CheB
MPKRNIIVIAASAGGVPALTELVQSLPLNFDASIFIVLHTPPSVRSYLPEILNNNGLLKAFHPEDGAKIKPRQIYIAPPDHHLLVDEDSVLVRKGPKENKFRPSADALFRSAAYTHGPRVIGVVLSGLLNDGTSGLWSVKNRGGITMVQEDPLYQSMPQNAAENVEVDYKVPISEMALLLTHLIYEEAPEMPVMPAEQEELMKAEVVIAASDHSFELGIFKHGEWTPFTCADCGGALINFQEGKTIRFRCHTGHAFTASSLLAGVTEEVEDQLWKTVRHIEETIMLLETISKKFSENGDAENGNKFQGKAKAERQRLETLRLLLAKNEPLSEDLQFERTLEFSSSKKD